MNFSTLFIKSRLTKRSNKRLHNDNVQRYACFVIKPLTIYCFAYLFVFFNGRRGVRVNEILGKFQGIWSQ